MKYKMTIYFKVDNFSSSKYQKDFLVREVEYEKEYELRRDMTQIGINGTVEVENGVFIYHSPFSIDKVICEPI